MLNWNSLITLYMAIIIKISFKQDEVYYSRIEGELGTISDDLEETEIEKTKVIQDLVDLEKRINSLNVISDKVIELSFLSIHFNCFISSTY